MRPVKLKSQITVVSSISSLVPESGGPSRSTTSLCSAVAATGIAVRLLSLDYGDKFQPPILPQAAQVLTELVPCRASRRFRIQWAPGFERALYNLLEESAAMIIHDNGLWSFTNHVAAKVARKQNIPMVLSTRGMLTPWALRYKSLKKWIGWRLFQYRDLRSSAVFHATSVEEAKAIRNLGFRQPIAVIPNGVEIPADTALKSHDSKTAVFLGRIHPVKGLLPLVEAWSRVKPSGWKMIIAGPDEANHRAEVESAIRAAGLTNQFQFTGPVEGTAKQKLLENAALLVMPSYTENFGMAIAEALAHGVPVLTTKGTPWQELPVRRCGWWVDLGASSLAEGLAEATELDAHSLKAMGERGKLFVQETLSWNRAGAEMRAVYEWVLGLGSRPACVQMC